MENRPGRLRFHHWAMSLLLSLLATSVVPAHAEESYAPLTENEQQIRSYDRQIFLELAKLAEFNIHFQQTVNHRARWRTLFYPAAQEATYGCFLGYSLTDISQRSSAWNNPRLISQTKIKGALATAATGALIGASSSMIELAANTGEAARASKEGFSVRKSVSFVQSTVQRVDELIASRHVLMEAGESTGTRRELLELKEQLLKYERDRLAFEFKRWSAHSRGYFWYRNAFYLINTAVNLGRFSAIQLGYNSFTERSCSGATGPILIASACLAGAGPMLSSAAGNCVKRHQQKALAKSLPVPPFLSEQEARQKFERLSQLLATNATSSGHRQLTTELIRLREEKLGLDKLIANEDRNIERLRRVAGQQAITAPIISSLGVASATLSTVGYYGYGDQPKISNRLSVAGDAAIISAEAVALVATPAAAIKAELYERQLKKRGEHPDQLLANRLKDLQEMRAIVNELWR